MLSSRMKLLLHDKTVSGGQSIYNQLTTLDILVSAEPLTSKHDAPLSHCAQSTIRGCERRWVSEEIPAPNSHYSTPRMPVEHLIVHGLNCGPCNAFGAPVSIDLQTSEMDAFLPCRHNFHVNKSARACIYHKLYMEPSSSNLRRHSLLRPRFV